MEIRNTIILQYCKCISISKETGQQLWMPKLI